MKRTGIIFDMDGTLWDSTKEVADSWSVVTVPKLGKQVTQEDMCRVMGMPMDKLAVTLFPEHELSRVLAVMEEAGKVENEYLAEHGASLYPDLIKTIRQLAEEYPLYIVSNCQPGYIETFLAYYDLEPYFKDFVCFGDNNLQKNENIALIMKRNNLDRGVYVGDIQADYEAAAAAGADFIHAAYGFGTVSAPVPAIREFAQLPQLLHELYPEK